MKLFSWEKNILNIFILRPPIQLKLTEETFLGNWMGTKFNKEGRLRGQYLISTCSFDNTESFHSTPPQWSSTALESALLVWSLSWILRLSNFQVISCHSFWYVCLELVSFSEIKWLFRFVAGTANGEDKGIMIFTSKRLG